MDIGERIRELRKEQGISQPELAKIIGVANSVISNWETGTNFPRGDYVALLAKTFNVTTDYLLGNEDEFGTSTNPKQEHYTKDEQQLIATYRTLSPGKKKALFDMLDISTESQQKKKA